jgi:hypothetical protein
MGEVKGGRCTGKGFPGDDERSGFYKLRVGRGNGLQQPSSDKGGII